MSSITSDPMLHKVPDAVAAQAGALGITDESCLFAVRSDMGLDEAAQETWLLATSAQVVVLAAGAAGAEPLAGPFTLSGVKKARCRQTVGSTFLQFMIDGLYVNVIRYSNARREAFARAREQIENLIEGEGVQEEALSRPSETVCGKCGLPLPGRGAECPKCSRQQGLLRRSVGLIWPYRGAIALLFLLMLVGVVVDLLPAQLTRILVDKVLVPRKNADWLPWILLALVTASGSRCVLNVVIGRISSKVSTRVTRELRERLQAKLVSLSVSYYQRHSVGSLMSRVLYDVDFFQGFVTQVTSGFLLNLMLVLGVGVILFVMNWHLALLVLLPIPFVVVGTMFFWRRIYPRYYRFWDSQSKMAQFLSGLLSGVRIVKAFGQEERERRRFSDCAGYMQSVRRQLDMGTATFNPIMSFVFGLGGLIVWYAGGNLVLGSEISLGTLMAFFGYLGMFYMPISALSMFSNWVTGFLSAAQRVFEILDSTAILPPPRNPVRMPKIEGKIEFRNVTFGYDPYTPVLKDVSFAIEPGQTIGVVGKSGSGKTTIMNLLCRFYDPQQGQILIDGVDVRDIDPDDLHRQVGLVLQEPFLFHASIAENIAYGQPGSSAGTIMDAARSANAHVFISARAAAYDTKLGERGAGLSGGERQRVSIAQVLLCEPAVLVLDEATSSVDTEAELEIQKALASIRKGRTTIAVAHRLSTLKNSDFIFVVDEGRIIESGSHEELMAIEAGLYRKLVKIQTELTRVEM